MHFNVYDVFYSQCSYQHVSVASTATFRVSSNQYTTPIYITYTRDSITASGITITPQRPNNLNSQDLVIAHY